MYFSFAYAKAEVQCVALSPTKCLHPFSTDNVGLLLSPYM